MQKEAISVSQYLDKINNLLKGEKAKIIGEVSGVQEYPGRSYLYFSIKDSSDNSTMKCFMWKRDFVISGVTLKDGAEIVVTAYPSVYKPNGGLTLQVEMVELVGEGALQKAYEKLKKKLELEGLFSEERKRPLPNYPERIGVVTSKSGAVINDFLTNIGKFGYEILFVDSRVEGADAIKELLSAMKSLKNKNLDVLVIMRGGGSLESFAAFNNEALIRAIAEFPAPVLTGIGHDKDLPLLSLVSDKNVSTPTAVANLLNSTWNEALSEVNLSEQKIIYNFGLLLGVFQKAEDTLLRAIDRIESGIKSISAIVDQEVADISRSFLQMLENINNILSQSKKTIDISNPERQLARGYSIVKIRGKILRRTKDTKRGDKLDILVSDGIIHSQTI